jgi:CRP-like cAMP-binding protein
MEIVDNKLFKNVNADILDLVFKNTSLKHSFSKGVIVAEETLYSPNLFIIKSGLVIISKTNQNGTEVSLSIKKKGDHFGQFSIFYEKPVNGKAVSLIETEYWVLNGSFLKSVLLKNLDFTFNLLKETTENLKVANECRYSNISSGAQKKLLYQLLRLGKKDKINNYVTISHDLNQSIMSSFTGITRETVSREIKKLKKCNVLTVNEHNQLKLDVGLATILLEAS